MHRTESHSSGAGIIYPSRQGALISTWTATGVNGVIFKKMDPPANVCEIVSGTPTPYTKRFPFNRLNGGNYDTAILSASEVDTATETITTIDWVDETPVVYASSRSLPGGLALDTKYYITRIDATHVKLGTTTDSLGGLGTCATDFFDSKGTGWTHDSGNSEYDSDGSQAADSDLTESGVLTDSALYHVEFEVKNYSAGNVCAVVGTQEGTDRSANGVYKENLTANGTGFSIRADADFVGSITNIKLRKIINLTSVGSGTQYMARFPNDVLNAMQAGESRYQFPSDITSYQNMFLSNDTVLALTLY